MSFENRNYAFAEAFVDELARCGLRHVCICPGSRSSPLAIAFARQPRIRKWVHLDERSAGFFALGIAKHLREPAAILCSSGTATANLMPAIVEAHLSLVPLLALTADRPPELQDWGALQTIDQTRLYGSHVKWSRNMPTPDVSPSLMAFVRSVAGRAMASANEKPAGPVHLNFPFREPLEPVNIPGDIPVSLEGHQGYSGRPDDNPFLVVTAADTMLDGANVRKLADELRLIERGIIVCGPEIGSDLAVPVVALARKLGFPVLADCLSQVRCGSHDRNMIIDCYDAFIGDQEVAGGLVPDVVLRLGALPVSKPLFQYLERHHAVRHITVDGSDSWRDPLYVTGEIWRADCARFCAELAASVEGEASGVQWINRWRSIAEATAKATVGALSASEQLFEGKVFTELSGLLPDGSLLFAGNSMPVRDMDTFFPSIERSIRFMANRGASGIDGVISTALGVSAVSSGRLTLVIGDISFYHDMNGLLAARAFGLNATIIVINNNGGGIFSFLPQSAYEDVFEGYFGTPHGLTFRAAAELYGLGYCLVRDWLTFNEAVKESLDSSGTTIIEVPGDRKLNVQLHRQVRDAVATALRSGRSR